MSQWSTTIERLEKGASEGRMIIVTPKESQALLDGIRRRDEIIKSQLIELAAK